MLILHSFNILSVKKLLAIPICPAVQCKCTLETNPVNAVKFLHFYNVTVF